MYFSITDEKEKYDPSAFRDAVIQGINDTEADLDLVSTVYVQVKLISFHISLWADVILS